MACTSLSDVQADDIRQWEILTKETYDSLLNMPQSGELSNQLNNCITSFKKEGDLMVHVSSFCIIDDVLYMTYYANRISGEEIPSQQIVRFVKCPIDDFNNKIYFDLQGAKDCGLSYNLTHFNGKTVNEIYDTVLMKRDDRTLYIMWSASLDGVYTRLFQQYDTETGLFGTISYNYFKVNDCVSLMDIPGIEYALSLNGIKHNPLEFDIGIMQRLSKRKENGTVYYYTGCYANTFNCIIKSRDLIVWEYVSHPTFPNKSQFENSVYVKDNKVYYFCRQEKSEDYAFITYYDLNTSKWRDPLLVYDSQSRNDIWEYNNNLYAIHAPIDRNHLSVLLIDTVNLKMSKEIQTAKVYYLFYPFVQYYNNQLWVSLTNARHDIVLSKFSIKY